MDAYTKIAKIGHGTYGVVYKAKNIYTNQYVAVKRIILTPAESCGLPANSLREIAVLKFLRHKNIIRLVDVLHDKRKLILVFECMETDLKKYLDQFSGVGLELSQIQSFMIQILRGVAFCHKNRILHRDLKPQNLLVNSNGELKIADFGLSRASNVPTRGFSTEVVTLWYRPPDILLGNTHYGDSIDLWSIGCIFSEMCVGSPLFPGAQVNHQLNLIFVLFGMPDEEIWPGVSQLPKYATFVRSPAATSAVASHLSTPGQRDAGLGIPKNGFMNCYTAPDTQGDLKTNKLENKNFANGISSGIRVEQGARPEKSNLEAAHLQNMADDTSGIGIPLDHHQQQPPPLTAAECQQQVTRANFSAMIPHLETSGIDLISEFLQLQPQRRIPAYRAIGHTYFDNIRNQEDCDLISQHETMVSPSKVCAGFARVNSSDVNSFLCDAASVNR